MAKEFPLKDSDLDFPHAFLIDASAGSGKTYNLALRYIQFLLSEKVKENSLSNILAVTFTDNATKEMKGRIIDFLKEIYFSEEKKKEISNLVSLPGEKLKQKADEILNSIFYNYSDFYVGTIDSFITRIISASADELKVNPDYELIFENDKLIDEIIEDFWKFIKKHNKLESIDKFLNTLNILGGKTFNFIPLNEIKDKFAQFLDKENKFLKEIKEVSIDHQKLDKLRNEIFKDILKLKNKYINFSLEIYKECEKAFEENNPQKLISSYNPDSGIFHKKKTFTEEISNDDFFVDLHKDIKRKISEYYEIESAIFFKAYSQLYLVFREFFHRYIHYSKYLSLSNVTNKISSYIKAENIPEIYLRLSAKFNHFLIDEFQDTSLAQWNIFRPLVEEALSKDGSLFLIGDTKQAIYMFRNADYRIMSRFREKGQANPYLNTASLKKGIEVFSLNTNYRSEPVVLDYIQNFFSSERFKTYLKDNIGSDLTGLLKSYQLPFKNRVGGYVKTCVFREEDDREREGLKRNFLQVIEDLKSRFDLKDIAVLVSKNEEVEEVVLWLNSKGIACASFSSLDIRKRKIINEILNFLKFLDNPQDNFSFLVFILGDIFSKIYPDKAKIIEFIFQNRNSTVPLYAIFKEKFENIWDEYFKDIFSKTGYYPVYEILTLIYTKFNLYNNFCEEQSFLLKLADISYEINVKKGTSSISQLLKFILSDYQDETFSISLSSSIDAVKVMTFHKAKGLGFGAVINLFIESREPNEDIYYFNSEDGIELRRIVKTYREFSNKIKIMYENLEREAQVQDLNTLYVALTRAEHELYNLVWLRKKAKNQSTTENLYSLFENFEKGQKSEYKTGIRKENFLKTSIKEKKKIYDFIKKGELETLETLRGDFYHFIFSKLVDINDCKRENIEKIINRASFKFFRNGELKEEALSKILNLLNNQKFLEFFKERPGRKIFNEVNFISEGGKVCRIDRMVEDNDCITIIDYKTGKKADYSLQMNFYKKVISNYLSKKVQLLICYIDRGEIEEI